MPRQRKPRHPIAWSGAPGSTSNTSTTIYRRADAVYTQGMVRRFDRRPESEQASRLRRLALIPRLLPLASPDGGS